MRMNILFFFGYFNEAENVRVFENAERKKDEKKLNETFLLVK